MNFTEQPYGYNKKEVDAYIERLKASYESKLMDEKLKTLESERRLLTFKNQHSDIAHKEKSIMEALDVLEKAKKSVQLMLRIQKIYDILIEQRDNQDFIEKLLKIESVLKKNEGRKI